MQGLSGCNGYHTVLKTMKVGGGVYSNKLGVVVVMTRETKEQLGASPTEAVEIVTGGWYLQRQGR